MHNSAHHSASSHDVDKKNSVVEEDTHDTGSDPVDGQPGHRNPDPLLKDTGTTGDQPAKPVPMDGNRGVTHR